MHSRLAPSLIMLMQLVAVRAFAADWHFTLRDRDLASATFGETHVVFVSNGAAVVTHGREAPMDLGLASRRAAWGRSSARKPARTSAAARGKPARPARVLAPQPRRSHQALGNRTPAAVHGAPIGSRKAR